MYSLTSTYVLPQSLVQVATSIPDLPEEFENNCLLVYDIQPVHVVDTQGGIISRIVPPGTQHLDFITHTIGLHISKNQHVGYA